jgi:phosphorylase/glycogen(starch) synthase
MRYLFEVSWEVCNKVGGIYTVITTKAAHAVAEYGENYYLLGPLSESNADFIEENTPDWEPIRNALSEKGLKCHFGRWAIEGRPKVILVDFHDRYQADKLLFEYWQKFGIDSYLASWDYIEPVIFSTACGEVIEAVYQKMLSEDDWVVAHFHEWMCGAGLLHIKKNVPEIGAVFTTHATVLGRSLASGGKAVHSNQNDLIPREDAKVFGVAAKHSMEAASAREADVFLSVSRVLADEAAIILDRRPDRVVFNGLNNDVIGSISADPSVVEQRRSILRRLAGSFLGRELPDNTRFWASSGRYEFHNKGFDVLLEALASLEKRVAKDDAVPPIVVWFLVATGHKGLHDDLRRKLNGEGKSAIRVAGLVTHRLYNEREDPIVTTCHKLGLRNMPEDKISVIFVPAYLDGHDGFFNIPYYQVLSACNLGVFPSFYEPWGYTPLECLALGVPTITTDCAGFGVWAEENMNELTRGVSIVARAMREDQLVVQALTSMLEEYAHIGDEALEKARQDARRIAGLADWSVFFDGYRAAYNEAATRSSMRLSTLDTSSFSDELFVGFKQAEANSPHFRSFTVITTLPKEIERLQDLAYNLWWSWHPDAQKLFNEIDPDEWEANNNPVRLLSRVSRDALKQKAADKAFISRYQRVIDDLDNYMRQPMTRYGEAEVLDAENRVAYFSMELCLHESLPIYSGGLGVLAGDHLKSASDLNIPLVGVGLLYRQGYFEQQIDMEGNQIERRPLLDCAQLPISPVLDEEGNEIVIQVDMGRRLVYARAWQVQVGRVKLYLLDTDCDENSPPDRQITWQLYGGGRKTRIEQEFLLGFGGVRLLEDYLGIKPAVYHLNEGHCGFLLLERIHRFIRNGFTFQEAREAVKSTSVFTSHTPVPAGNEAFEPDLVEHYFNDFAQTCDISWNQFLELGRAHPGDENQPFSMTVLALKLSSAANGVSRLHGAICRDMWQDVWTGILPDEVPIISITNGIHITSWLGRKMRRLLTQYLDIRWDENHNETYAWQRVDDIPDEMFWEQHLTQKRLLIEKVKKKIFTDYVRRGENPQLIRETIDGLNPEALTIGFARRFATYKRAGLLLKDLARLDELLRNEKRPVQFLLAGKAHSADTAGKALIKEIVSLTRSERFRGKIVYLENYGMALGRLMTQGSDVWLNTPRRPHEASGTSGMKAVPNGVLNCSILDGWWDEAYTEEAGWAIDSGALYSNIEHQDEMDGIALFDLLENKIVPSYYTTNEDGVPVEWVKMMKQALMTIAPYFNTMRMVDEYYRQMYRPVAERGKRLAKNNWALVRELTAWKRRIHARFSTVFVEKVAIKGIKGDLLPSDTPLEVEMIVNPGRLSEKEIAAELVIGLQSGGEQARNLRIIPFEVVEHLEGSMLLRYRLTFIVNESGNYVYAVRTVPIHPLLVRNQETGLVRWA